MQRGVGIRITGNPGLNFAPWPLVTAEVVNVTSERTEDIGVRRGGNETGHAVVLRLCIQGPIDCFDVHAHRKQRFQASGFGIQEPNFHHQL